MQAHSTPPRLIAGVEIVPLSADRLMLRSFDTTLVLSGEFVTSTLHQLLLQLDGRLDVRDLVKEVGPDFRLEVEALLLELEKKGLLVSGAPTNSLASSASALLPREAAYWELQTGSALDAEQRLAAASILICGLGGIGTTIAKALVAAGVGRLTLLDAAAVSQHDIGFGFEKGDVGRIRAEALADRLTGGSTVAGLQDDLETLSGCSDILSAVDHVVMCSDTMSLPAVDRLNAACLTAGTAWLPVRVDRNSAIIGPYVVPGDTACFTCYELRNRANSDYPDDHGAIFHFRTTSSACAGPWPALASFTAVIGHLVAIDLLGVIAGRKLPAALGRIIHMSPGGFTSKHHEILKLPRCPACSRLRSRPMSRIWDIKSGTTTQPVPERKG